MFVIWLLEPRISTFFTRFPLLFEGTPARRNRTSFAEI